MRLIMNLEELHIKPEEQVLRTMAFHEDVHKVLSSNLVVEHSLNVGEFLLMGR